MKKRIIALVILVIAILLIILSLSGCASWDRAGKSISSEMSGGLNRTVTVYDNNGTKIKSWTGKIDLQTSDENNKVLFDVNGKRVVIQGGTTIIEEN